MDGISCDRCGEGLLLESDVRYVMELRIEAAYDPMELTQEDLNRDFDQEFKAILASMDGRSEQELQDEVAYRARFDLCPRCRKEILRDPLQRPKT